MTLLKRMSIWFVLAAALAGCGAAQTLTTTSTVTVVSVPGRAPARPPVPPAVSTSPTSPSTPAQPALTSPSVATPPPVAPAAAQRAARTFSTNYLAYSYGFAPLAAVEPAATSVRTYLAQGRHVPTSPAAVRPKIIGLKFASVAGGYIGVLVTYSTTTSVSSFAFDISAKSGRWQADQIEG